MPKPHDAITCPCCQQRNTLDAARDNFSGIATALERTLFEATKNGMHAWIAYREARKRKLPVPEWVLRYLDRCYTRLAAPKGTASAAAITTALQLDTKGGGPTARNRAITARRERVILERVTLHQQRAAMKGRSQINDLIFGEVATDLARAGITLSPRTIRNTYYRLKPAKPSKRHSRK